MVYNKGMNEVKESRIHLRGLASASPEKRAQIAAMGGRKAHELGKAHKFTSEQAREAGRKGGLSNKNEVPTVNE
jgi:general stress protein YciG